MLAYKNTKWELVLKLLMRAFSWHTQVGFNYISVQVCYVKQLSVHCNIHIYSVIMPKEIIAITLKRNKGEPWGLRIGGGVDRGKVLVLEKVSLFK